MPGRQELEVTTTRLSIPDQSRPCGNNAPMDTSVLTHSNANAIAELQKIRPTLITNDTDDPAVSPIRYREIRCG
jgi:hypothetical protein